MFITELQSINCGLSDPFIVILKHWNIEELIRITSGKDRMACDVYVNQFYGSA